MTSAKPHCFYDGHAFDGSGQRYPLNDDYSLMSEVHFCSLACTKRYLLECDNLAGTAIVRFSHYVFDTFGEDVAFSLRPALDKRLLVCFGGHVNADVGGDDNHNKTERLFGCIDEWRNAVTQEMVPIVDDTENIDRRMYEMKTQVNHLKLFTLDVSKRIDEVKDQPDDEKKNNVDNLDNSANDEMVEMLATMDAMSLITDADYEIVADTSDDDNDE
jgi:hypothetical protein